MGVFLGRKKFHSHGLIKFKTKGKKKLSKILYPIIVGLITAKSIIIPLFFKAVVVLSKFSFFVSTLSFIISSILGIKVLLLSNNNNRRSNDNTRVEVVHVPLQQKYPTTYSSSHSAGWIDRDSENKFIPIAGNEGERIIYEKPYSEQEKGLEKDSYLPLWELRAILDPFVASRTAPESVVDEQPWIPISIPFALSQPMAGSPEIPHQVTQF